jgi:hypothetical protein
MVLFFQGMLSFWDWKFFAEDSGLPGCDAASWGMRSLMVLGPQSFRMLINARPLVLCHIPDNLSPYWLWTEFTVTVHSYLMVHGPHPSLVYISGLLCWVTVSLKVTFFFRSWAVNLHSLVQQPLFTKINAVIDIVFVQVSDYSRRNYETCDWSTWGESV